MTPLVRSAIVLLYPRTDLLPGAEDCDLDRFLARFRRESTTLVWLGVVLGAVVFHLSPVFMCTCRSPRSSCRPTWRTATPSASATAMSTSCARRSSSVKFAAGLAWGAHPSVRARFALAPMPADPGTWRMN